MYACILGFQDIYGCILGFQDIDAFILGFQVLTYLLASPSFQYRVKISPSIPILRCGLGLSQGQSKFSQVLLHVIFGRPWPLLSEAGVHFRAVLGILGSFILRMCPSSLCLRFLIVISSFHVPDQARSCSSLFVIELGRKILWICRSHLFWKVSNLCKSLAVILHVSAPYSSYTDSTLLLNSLTFVLIERFPRYVCLYSRFPKCVCLYSRFPARYLFGSYLTKLDFICYFHLVIKVLFSPVA